MWEGRLALMSLPGHPTRGFNGHRWRVYDLAVRTFLCREYGFSLLFCRRIRCLQRVLGRTRKHLNENDVTTDLTLR